MRKETLSKERDKIIRDCLERYTGSEIKDFQPYILLTNFRKYLTIFADQKNFIISNCAFISVDFAVAAIDISASLGLKNVCLGEDLFSICGEFFGLLS